MLLTGDQVDEETQQDACRYARAVIQEYLHDTQQDSENSEAEAAVQQLVQSAAGLYQPFMCS